MPTDLLRRRNHYSSDQSSQSITASFEVKVLLLDDLDSFFSRLTYKIEIKYILKILRRIKVWDCLFTFQNQLVQ
ncbi:unnamed protein product [Rhizophagus irregularis]|nr:unnamed protein product [Rhizophagus irregularis]